MSNLWMSVTSALSAGLPLVEDGGERTMDFVLIVLAVIQIILGL